MLSNVIASSVDRAFLAATVRRSLPRLSIHRGLRRLAIAEARTQREIPDSALFCESARQGWTQTPGAANALGVRELRVTQVLEPIAIAAKWGCWTGMGELSSLWRLRDVPRPLLVLVGGWNATRYLTPARLWPLAALDRLNVDIAIPCLQWRWRESNALRTFPSNDPCMNVIAVASLVNGLVQIIERARSQGHPSVSVFAASLGAHLAALVATLPAAQSVDRFVLEKPLGHLSDLVRWHAPGDPTWCHHVADRLERVYRSVDPLQREPTVAPERVTVIGATFDRVTPLEAAHSVASHFHVPLQPIKASHLFDPGRSRRLLQLAQGLPRSQREL
jgi:hypothetical protein